MRAAAGEWVHSSVILNTPRTVHSTAHPGSLPETNDVTWSLTSFPTSSSLVAHGRLRALAVAALPDSHEPALTNVHLVAVILVIESEPSLPTVPRSDPSHLIAVAPPVAFESSNSSPPGELDVTSTVSVTAFVSNLPLPAVVQLLFVHLPEVTSWHATHFGCAAKAGEATTAISPATSASPKAIFRYFMSYCSFALWGW